MNLLTEGETAAKKTVPCYIIQLLLICDALALSVLHNSHTAVYCGTYFSLNKLILCCPQS